jgi:hypothetical protein
MARSRLRTKASSAAKKAGTQPDPVTGESRRGTLVATGLMAGKNANDTRQDGYETALFFYTYTSFTGGPISATIFPSASYMSPSMV